MHMHKLTHTYRSVNEGTLEHTYMDHHHHHHLISSSRSLSSSDSTHIPPFFDLRSFVCTIFTLVRTFLSFFLFLFQQTFILVSYPSARILLLTNLPTTYLPTALLQLLSFKYSSFLPPSRFLFPLPLLSVPRLSQLNHIFYCSHSTIQMRPSVLNAQRSGTNQNQDETLVLLV